MDLQRVRDAMVKEFARDIRDGTIAIQANELSVVLDGGNWSLTTHQDGAVSLDLPMKNPNYYDDDLNVFLENVINLEVEESLAMADQTLGGALTEGLRRSGETWSEVLAERIASIRV